MSQSIICFEGPSGIGKTTMCNLLLDQFNIVPEVNLLFERTYEESKFWYYERQLDRYRYCRKSKKDSILDGDIFQPIWYNWACNYPTNFASKIETHNFYKAKLIEGEIKFPDLYIVFHCDEKELHRRKENDKTRQRRNFEKHLKIIPPLMDYYSFLDKETDIEMRFIEYSDIKATKKKVLDYIRNTPNKSVDQMETYEKIEHWLDSKAR